MAIAIALSALGDLLTKQAVSASEGGTRQGDARPLLRNGRFILGIGLLTLQFFAYLAALRSGPVSVVVPMMSCTYILTTLLGYTVLGERVPRLRWAGVVVIVIGVALLGMTNL